MDDTGIVFAIFLAVITLGAFLWRKFKAIPDESLDAESGRDDDHWHFDGGNFGKGPMSGIGGS